jgi:hypothetical protein
MPRHPAMRTLLVLALGIASLVAADDWPSEAEIAAITYDDALDDNSFVGPFAHDYGRNDEFPERKVDWQAFVDKLNAWAPGKVADEPDKVRNLINACALQDICQGQFEGELALFVYTRLKDQVPKERLVRILARITLHPDQGEIIRTAPELDADVGVGEDQIRERLQVYAKKMLGRVLGKIPPPEPPPEKK